MTSDDDYQTPSMSRREALAGGSAAAVAVGAGLMSNSLVRRAQALSAGDARIVMGDQGESPAQNGEITLNSPDVEIHSGGAVRNLTNPTVESISTAEEDITNESYVEADLSSTTSTISSGTWTNALDNTTVDSRSEWNGTDDQFVPDKTAVYRITATIGFTSVTDQDRCDIRLRNVTESVTIRSRNRLHVAVNTDMIPPFQCVSQLSAGDAYELQARDADSSYQLRGGDVLGCKAEFVREPVTQ